MKKFIGGLFKNRQNVERARNALREQGLDDGSINLLQCTHEKEAVLLEKNPSIRSIGKGALAGAMILGGIGLTIFLETDLTSFFVALNFFSLINFLLGCFMRARKRKMPASKV